MTDSTTLGERAIGRLRRVLGVGFGLAVIVGSTLGIGILRTPGTVAAELHTPGVIMALWIAGGVYTLLGAASLAELGTLAPQVGGYYVYARRAFGVQVGFVVGWTDWLTYCAVLGYASIGMAELVGTIVPGLADATRPVAIALLAGFVVLQWAGVRVTSWFQEWTTALKFLAFLALVVVALVMSGGSVAAPPAPRAPPVTWSGMAAALQSIVITYAGWQSALYFTEEDRDPRRNLPRAMIGGVVAVIVVYLLVNVALLAILPVATLGASKLPATEAARLIVGERAGQIMAVLQLVSLLPLLNAILMIGTRILFALSRDRLFWSRAARINPAGTPDLATIATTVPAIALIIAVGDFQRLVGIAAFFLALNYVVCALALVELRRREPITERPFRAWGYPWSAVLVIAGALAVLVGTVLGDHATSAAAICCCVVLGLVSFAFRSAHLPGAR